MPTIQRLLVLLAVLMLHVSVRSAIGDEEPRLLKTAANSIAFSPDGTAIATVNFASNIVTIWNIANSEKATHLKGHVYGLYAVAWSPDGKLLASAGTDHEIRLWDAASFEERAMLSGHNSTIRSLAFSPDSTLLASGCRDRTAKIWDIVERKARVTIKPGDFPMYVVFAPDGKVLATAYSETVRFWSVDSGQQIGALPKQSRTVSAVAYSPGGKALATISRDMTLKRWELSPQRQLLSINTGATLYSLAYSPDGKFIAAEGANTVLRLYRATTGEVVATLGARAEGIASVAFSPNGKFLAAGGSGGVMLWDVTAYVK